MEDYDSDYDSDRQHSRSYRNSSEADEDYYDSDDSKVPSEQVITLHPPVAIIHS